MKLKIEAILEYDADLMHGDDPEEVNWFHEILRGPNLILHDNGIGDYIGSVLITSIEGTDDHG